MTTKTKRTPKPYRIVKSDGNAYGGAIYIYEAPHAVTGEAVRFRVERRSLGGTVWGFARLYPIPGEGGEGRRWARRWVVSNETLGQRIGKGRALSAALKTFCEIEH